MSPRGKVLENGNSRFFRRLAEGIFDEEDLIFRANELADFVEEACREYHLNCGSVTAIGYFNGANIAAGQSDPIVLIEETKRLSDLLRDAGANVTLHWEKSGHAITDGDIQAAGKWLEREM